MTIKALITLLQDFDENKQVVIETNDCLIEEMVVNPGLDGEIVITEF